MDEMTPKVSVVIPVYNVERYLQDCIDSLLAQTMEDIELIFVDDASTDCSLKILEDNAQRYPEKMRVINCKENRRQGAARNIGIREARGEYIGFVDSDDFVLDTMYQSLYDEIIRTDADACFIRYIQVPNEMTRDRLAKESLAQYTQLPDWREELVNKNGLDLTEDDITDLIAENLGGVWCGLWKRGILIENNIWFPEELRYEDNYWTSLIRCYLKKIAFCDEVGYVYRLSADSTMRVSNAAHHYDRITVEKMLWNELKTREGVWNKHCTAWEYIFISRYCFNTYFHFLERFDKPDMKFLKGLFKDLNHTFPKWRLNRYFKQCTSKKYRILCNLIMVAPRLMAVALRHKL